MDESEMMEAISESLTDYLEDEDFNIKTFDDKVFLTGDKGLFLKFNNCCCVRFNNFSNWFLKKTHLIVSVPSSSTAFST